MTHGPVEQLLRKAKAWFTSERRLVRHWIYFFEYADGRPMSEAMARRRRVPCRACVIGSVRIHARDPRIEAAAIDLLISAAPALWQFYKPHTLGAVRSIYDRAIALARKEGV